MRQACRPFHQTKTRGWRLGFYTTIAWYPNSVIDWETVRRQGPWHVYITWTPRRPTGYITALGYWRDGGESHKLQAQYIASCLASWKSTGDTPHDRCHTKSRTDPPMINTTNEGLQTLSFVAGSYKLRHKYNSVIPTSGVEAHTNIHYNQRAHHGQVHLVKQ